MSLHRFQNVADGKGNRIQIHESVTAPRQLDDVARERAETKRRAVDQAELALLHRIDVSAPPPLQGLRQEQNRGQWRPEVVRDLHHQFQTIGSRQAIGEVLRPVRLQPGMHLFDGAEDGKDGFAVGRLGIPPDSFQQLTADQFEKAAGQDGARNLVRQRFTAVGGGANRPGELHQMGANFLLGWAVFDDLLPSSLDVAHGLVE